MQAAALVTSLIAQGVLGLTARDRFQSLRQYDNTSIFVTRWFVIAMIVILSVSIFTLIIVSLVQHREDLKQWWAGRHQRALERKKRIAEERGPSLVDAAESRQKTAVKNFETAIRSSAAAYENDLRELGQIADTKVVNLARQMSSQIEAAELNEEQTANLVDYLISRYVPLNGQIKNGVTK